MLPSARGRAPDWPTGRFGSRARMRACLGPFGPFLNMASSRVVTVRFAQLSGGQDFIRPRALIGTSVCAAR